MQRIQNLIHKGRDILEWNNKRIKKLHKKILNYYDDKERQERLKSNLCKWCYYMEADEVVMSAFTTQICKGCAKTNIYGNSKRHMYCEECAEKMHLCKHCGSVID